MNRFDDAYRGADDFFGDCPERTLVDHIAKLKPDLPVLDIGCGQGRNPLFLARKGLTVDALDPSTIAADQVSRVAAEHQLPVRTIHGTFQSVEAGDGTYGAILAFGLMPLLRLTEIDELADWVTTALCSGGLLFVTAFGTWDPAISSIASVWEPLGNNSFCDPDGDLRTYLEPGELLRIFSDLDPIHTWEGLGPAHRHGSGPIERHGLAEAVLRH